MSGEYGNTVCAKAPVNTPTEGPRPDIISMLIVLQSDLDRIIGAEERILSALASDEIRPREAEHPENLHTWSEYLASLSTTALNLMCKIEHVIH